MTTREVAQMCGVTDKTVIENAKKFGKQFQNGQRTEWTEDELRQLQAVLMGNTTKRGAATTNEGAVEQGALRALQASLTLQELIRTGNVEAIKEFTQIAIDAAMQQNSIIEYQRQNQLLLEQKEAAEMAYNEEREDNEKNKELVRHMYLSAAEVKDKVHAITGKWVVISKAVRRIPLKDNYVLYKPFKNGNYTGQTAVYHPDVVDLIAESLF